MAPRFCCGRRGESRVGGRAVVGCGLLRGGAGGGGWGGEAACCGTGAGVHARPGQQGGGAGECCCWGQQQAGESCGAAVRPTHRVHDLVQRQPDGVGAAWAGACHVGSGGQLVHVPPAAAAAAAADASGPNDGRDGAAGGGGGIGATRLCVHGVQRLEGGGGAQGFEQACRRGRCWDVAAGCLDDDKTTIAGTAPGGGP